MSLLHDETTLIIATIAATIMTSPIDLSNLIIIIRGLRSLMSSSIVYGFVCETRKAEIDFSAFLVSLITSVDYF